MKRIASIFVLTLLLVACKEEQSGGSANLIDRCSVVATREVTGAGDTVVVCDLAKVKEKAILRLSQLVDSLEFIRLEIIDTAMVGGENVLNISISDNYIGVNSTHSYKLFTRTGKYITDIGRQGQGPGGYTYVYTSQIDEAHDRIFLLPWTALGILEYDLRGNFIGKIPLPYMVSKGAMKVDVDNGRITVAKLPWGEDDSPTVWVQDFDGRCCRTTVLRIWIYGRITATSWRAGAWMPGKATWTSICSLACRGWIRCIITAGRRTAASRHSPLILREASCRSGCTMSSPTII